ncbi:MAG TPA: sulfotransferase domain-containing protein [Ktedonobacteraceae bacterium]|nr:sulfotransferase domain-containing protein [Ktedonobacteraceae bacterium]
MATIDKAALKKAFRASTNPFRMTPDFIIIGAQKAGTTSLYRYLTEHPCIAPIYVKEPHYFDIYFYKGLSWYRSHFPMTLERYYAQHIAKHDLMTGEASPYYLFHPRAAQRVAKTLPRVKLIALLRNPIDRAYSQYQHQARQPGVEPLSFEDALDAEAERLANEEEKIAQDPNYSSFNHRHYSYCGRSRYVEQLPRWINLFPQEQVLILNSEELFSDPAAIVKQALIYLNLPIAGMKSTYKPFNEARYAPMKAATRQRLVEYFKPYNERLYELLGRDFEWDK